jgi:hypothetical protein
MIGYKKCVYLDVDPAGTKVREALVTLEVPDDAKIVIPISMYPLYIRPLKKLRCEAAKVLDIVDAETREPVPCAFSAHSMAAYFVRSTYMPENGVPESICTYIKNKMVVADRLDEDQLNECSNGIHFFLTEKEALEYKL